MNSKSIETGKIDSRSMISQSCNNVTIAKMTQYVKMTDQTPILVSKDIRLRLHVASEMRYRHPLSVENS